MESLPFFCYIAIPVFGDGFFLVPYGMLFIYFIGEISKPQLKALPPGLDRSKGVRL